MTRTSTETTFNHHGTRSRLQVLEGSFYRRLANEILSVDDPDARKRFLREGLIALLDPLA